MLTTVERAVVIHTGYSQLMQVNVLIMLYLQKPEKLYVDIFSNKKYWLPNGS